MVQSGARERGHGRLSQQYIRTNEGESFLLLQKWSQRYRVLLPFEHKRNRTNQSNIMSGWERERGGRRR